jgi:dipeptidyl aminopeptidase/acylaminoacyl peptidase
VTKSGWISVPGLCGHKPVTLSIYQDLNRAPVLMGTGKGRTHVTVWDPNPQLVRIALGKASVYEWHDQNGASRSGILVLPPDYKPGNRYPLVIQTHGYESRKFFADGIYTTGSGGRALCGRGMIVLQTEQYSRSEDSRSDAEVEVAAYGSAVRQLSTEGLVDPRRVGIIGFSFTVYHVLYSITHYPDQFAAASITDGNDLSYWLYLLWTDMPVAQQMAEQANGGVKPFGKNGLLKWQESAPGFNLDRTQSPLLISCLEKGTLVASWDIYGALRTLKKPVEMVWLTKEDAPHVLVQPRHRYLSQELAVDWFDFWLNEHEDPSPRKASQYVKWRQLRTLKTNKAPGAQAGDL